MSVGAYRIRAAAGSDLAALPGLDPSAVSPARLGAARDAGLLWVAAAPGMDAPVGYLAAGRLEQGLLVEHIAVAAAHRRRGVGATLLAAAVDRARWSFEPAVLLVADPDLPWSGPFFARYGFVSLAPTRLPPDLAARVGRGGPHASRLVAMAKRL
ncbi:GNAT family N-acetyltransferase [Salinarimonas soli]|uniref:GNAT family N-acetyltransferase n=1 Tax=Salinarimonas soli TaxID=1638099 RepID=A0A5B2VU17_9HYPH|nr:GNAT family N-acetyltransferase [Salinarimonas soli]KAA2242098.1 GNAT family N-acetyltransferase [Salinarimonas soli]